MKGYHKVKVFVINEQEEVNLPEGWKPFAAEVGQYRTRVIARKWERTGE